MARWVLCLVVFPLLASVWPPNSQKTNPILPEIQSTENKSQKKKNKCMLDARAKILKKVSWEKLWEKFLSSTSTSFALSSSEAAALLRECIALDGTSAPASAGSDDSTVDADIAKYIDMVDALEEQYRLKNVKVNMGGAKVVDFMALVSSVLLLGSTPFEDKIDQLFKWIVLSAENDEMGFQDFIVAMSSFERGLSNAMGFPASTELFVIKTAKEWLALADPSQKGAVTKETMIKSKNFFEFCSNRQHVVRKLLELLAQSEVAKDKNSDVSATEAVTALAASGKDDEMVASGGDEWMANPAWKKTAEKMLPKSLVPNSTKPSTSLDLDWVHGYRGFDCRNNLAYLDDGGTQFFFFAAALGVCQDSSKWTQKFFGEHSDDIISMTVYRAPNKSALIATGEMGKTPAIQIYEWKNSIFTPKAAVRGFHTKGVCQLAFSKDGKTLFSVGVEYTVAIISTDTSAPSKFGKMTTSSQGPKDKILGCCYAGATDGSSFLSCGEKHTILWTMVDGALLQSKTKMTFTPKPGDKDAIKVDFKNKMYMCAVPGIYKSTIVGTSDGDIITLASSPSQRDKEIDSFICSAPSKTNEVFCSTCVMLGAGSKSPHGTKAHNKAVNALWSNELGDIVVSGCAEGKIIVWKMSNEKGGIASFFKLESLMTTGPMDAATPQQIRSLCVSMSADQTQQQPRLLIGTSQCEVTQFKFKDSSMKEIDRESKIVMVNGHFRDELWGLAVRPLSTEDPETNGEYCTVGDDGFLRIWSVSERCQLSWLNIKGANGASEMARCCAYSPDGQYIAVGFGGSVGKGKNTYDGTVRIYRTWKGASPGENQKPVAEFKEAKAFISCICFSPDGTTLAVGARDNSIYLYSVTQNFKRKAKFSKHNAGILFLDFTADGKYLQSCCSGYEILFSDATTGVQMTNGASLLTDAEWANWTCSLGWATIGIWGGGMDGTDVNAVDRSPSGKLLALGDDFGKVKVYRFPATQEGGSQFNSYSGHSSHVTNTRWITTRSPKKGEAPSDDYLISIGGNDKCVFQWKNSGAEVGGGHGGSAAAASEADSGAASHSAGHEHSEGGALDDGPGGGDEFTACKPWLGAIVAPSAWAPKGSTPAQKDTFMTKLGDLSLKHASLTSKEAKRHGMQGAIYAEVQAACRSVRTALSESGVEDSSAPTSDELELEWVHGYRGHDCRNNVFYVDEKTVIYHAAALGVSTDLSQRTPRQRYFRGHTDDIMSMAVRRTADQVLVATGQQAKGNTYVWDAHSLKTLAVLQTQQKSINMLEFSKADGGRLLVSIAEDKSVVVSDWKSQTVLANTKGEAAVTYHIAAGSQTGNFSFMSVGDKHLKLWSLNGRNLTSTKVLLGSVAGPLKSKSTGAQTYWCVVEVKGQYLIGAEDSYVYVVSKDQKTLEKSFACSGKVTDKDKGFGVTAMLFDESRGLLLCGTKDGYITGFRVDDALLDPKLSVTAAKNHEFQFSVDCLLKAPHEIMAKQVNGLAIKPGSAGLVLLVSTRGCDLLQVDMSHPSEPKLAPDVAGRQQGVLQRSHCNDEVWGLCPHPLLPQYATVGDDKTLRFFCIKSRCMLRAVPLGLMSRTLCYNPAGNVLALGFGGRVGKGKEPGGGVVRLYSAEHTFKGNTPEVISEKLAEAKDAKEWISDIKFSSDGRILCAGAHDCKIYIYTVSVDGDGLLVKAATLTLAKTFTKHNSVINHIDLSSDGRFMQSNCSAYELLFCDTTTGKQITSATELKDVKWDTWTCTLGWPVQGIWAPGMDGSDINAVARSNSGHLVATSDDLGKVRLFRYPCIKENSANLSYAGHSSHVTCVRWTAADECLISTGGEDKCVFQWRHTMCGGGATGKPSADADDWDDEFAVGGGAGGGGSGAGEAGGKGGEEGHDVMVASGGDESGCVKPWLGAVRTPKNPPPVNPAAPSVSIGLKWVHGYTSASAGAGNVRVSNNLYYGDDGSAVYPAAALGVVMKRNPQAIGGLEQKYFTGMNDDILCLAISPNRCYVATGQTASKTSKGKAGICVWDARDCRLLCRMDSCHQRAVVSLAFSPEGTDLMSVGQDDNNTHILWTDKGGSWSRVQQVATAPSDKNAVLFGRFLRPNAQKDWDVLFASGGAQAINFWKLEGATLVKKTGRFGKAKQAPLLCAANLQQPSKSWGVVVGTAAGDLYVYGKDREVGNGGVDKAHMGSVLCICEGNAECTFLVSGGKDKFVRVWNQALQRVSSFDLTKLSIVDASIASVDVRPVRESAPHSLSLLAGTYGGEIIEVTSNPDKDGAVSKGDAPAASSDKSAFVDTRNLDLADARTEVLLYSHYSGELWGCATHPVDRDLFVSVGDDSTLRLWSIGRNCPLSQIDIGWPGRSVAWHPFSTTGTNGVSFVAVGFMEAVKGGVAKKGDKKAAAAGGGKGGGKAGGAAGGAAGGDAASGDAAAAVGGGANAAAAAAAHVHDKAIEIFVVYQDNAGSWIMRRVASGCDSAAWIGDVKWSNDGRILAGGSHDKKLYAFEYPDISAILDGKKDVGKDSSFIDHYAEIAKMLAKPKYVYNKHSSSVNHFDFSEDNLYFQSNCQAAELLFAEAKSGKQETSATKMAEYHSFIEDAAQAEKGECWATQTCVLGWAVQGIWPPGADTSDINACDRSSNRKLLATADDFGGVKLFRYPAVQEGSKFVEATGHSSHVTCVRFNVSNDVLISTGGNDKCVFVWNLAEK